MKKINSKNNQKDLAPILVTTPIYYPSSKPHVGHVFSTLIADIIKRYYKQRKHPTFFITGTDEHGSKIYETALKHGQTPREYVDQIVEQFKELWKKLNFDYDQFWRTTNPLHEQRLKEIFKLLKDHIYFGQWSGYYCVQCEENYNESQIIYESKQPYCKFHHPLKIVKENSYFFKMAEETEWIRNFLKQSDNFIHPLHRRNELLNTFLSNQLLDLSISRENLSWGVKVPGDPKYTIYVWIDALTYYLTSLGYPDQKGEQFATFWMNEQTQVIQIMSKEIIRFHGIYWPIILKSLGLPIPLKIIAHGWIVDDQNVKMSKSLTNTIDPMEWLKVLPADAIRYYLAKEISLAEDSKCSTRLLWETYHADLVNKIGNLLLRVNTMLHKFCHGVIPPLVNVNAVLNSPFYHQTLESIKQFDQAFTANEINRAIKSVVKLVENANTLVEQEKPWILASQQKTAQLNECLVLLANSLRVAFSLLEPILVDGSQNAYAMMNFSPEVVDYNNLTNLEMICGIKVNPGEILYQRLAKKTNGSHL